MLIIYSVDYDKTKILTRRGEGRKMVGQERGERRGGLLEDNPTIQTQNFTKLSYF